LSLWYKLTDRTEWGMYFSIVCFVLMLGLNIWLVKLIGIPDGYMGSAWAALISYFLVMVFSYFVGRRYYPLPYELKRCGAYCLLALLIWIAGAWMEGTMSIWLAYILRGVLLVVYVGVVAMFEQIPLLSPMIRKLTGKIGK
ncbi:MAG: polysaccharide biosynthesis C-terminal domain-containing protein, partial [Muribaculaceae bacterium]|nr:polysaccharide biosynthesis C-terminal domain-containing protein [Muribaculaceae bacterium]